MTRPNFFEHLVLSNLRPSTAVLCINRTKFEICWSNPQFDQQFTKLLNLKLFIPFNQSINQSAASQSLLELVIANFETTLLVEAVTPKNDSSLNPDDMDVQGVQHHNLTV